MVVMMVVSSLRSSISVREEKLKLQKEREMKCRVFLHPARSISVLHQKVYKEKNKCKATYVVDILEIDIVSESVLPELKLASSESLLETGL